MLDNGLLKYYRDFADKKGRLRMDKAGFVADREVFYHVYTYYLRDSLLSVKNRKLFYCKERLKDKADAEILISQLYPSLGVPSAISTPANRCYDGFYSLLSNDVEKNGYKRGLYNFEGKLKQLSTGKVEDVLKDFSPNAVKQILTMQTLDMATYNFDRHLGNLFVKANAGKPVEGIITIDHESSATGLADEERDELVFINCLRDDYSSRKEIIRDLKTSELASSVMSVSGLAEQIGAVDVASTAQDIKDQTGYEISSNYVQALQRSFDKTAEELIQ